MRIYTFSISIIAICYIQPKSSQVKIPDDLDLHLAQLSEVVLDKTKKLYWLIISEGNMTLIMDKMLTDLPNNRSYMLIDDIRMQNKKLKGFNKYSYFIIIESVDTLRTIVTKLQSYEYWNCNSIFVIINVGHDILNPEIFLVMWEHRILNVLLINLNLKMTSYKIDKCGENITLHQLSLNNVSNFMNNNMIRNFEKCEVRIIAMKHPPFVINAEDRTNPGINIIALRIMAKKANFTIKYVKHNISNLRRELHLPTLYRLLYVNAGDVLIILTISEHYNVFDISGHFLFMNFATYYQNPGQLPVGILVFQVYGPIIWILLGVSVMVLGFMSWLGLKNKANLIDSILIIYAMLLTSFRGQPKLWYQRLIFITWAVSAFFILCSYSGILISLFSVPEYMKPYDSLAQMVYQNYNIGTFPYTKTMFQTEGNKNQFYWFDCPIALQCLKLVYDDPKLLYIMSSRLAEYYMAHNFTTRSGRPAFVALKEDVQFIPTQWMYHKGFPMYQYMNWMMAVMVEGGLIDKWAKDATSHKRVEVRTENQVLTYSHFQYLFYILYSGYAIGSVCFMLEMFVYRKCKKMAEKVYFKI